MYVFILKINLAVRSSIVNPNLAENLQHLKILRGSSMNASGLVILIILFLISSIP